MQVVWFKRDLRLRDHRPLARACERRDVVCLYVVEPSLLQQAEFDSSHWVFIRQALVELDRNLRDRDGHLVVKVGEVVDVLQWLDSEYGIDGLWSHEETGNMLTYERDLAVADWATERGVRWTEIPQHGIFRPIGERDGWAKRWDARMQESVTTAPDHVPTFGAVGPTPIPTCEDLGLPPSTKDEAQKGGEVLAWETLHSFLDHRGLNYRTDMSSPVEGWEGCSRLSTYLAFGNIAMREVYQETKRRVDELRAAEEAGEEVDKNWFKSLRSFEGRLHWHCHFMQKLEDEPRIEFENLARSYDGMREDEFDDARFEAYKAGETGYPMVDACMRCLHRSGWLNFRMRAMMVSFSSYHLWLHWRPTALWLGKHFLDFEPGIHFPQVQMQSGTTGINAIRIYSPPKQVKDQDPDGVFIKKYVPELRDVPSSYLWRPEAMSAEMQDRVGCVIGTDYPEPIVHHGTAYNEAKRRVWEVKKTPEAKAEASEIYERHGSRKR